MVANLQSAGPHASSTNEFPVVANRLDYQRVRDVLAAAGYNDKGITQVLGVDSLNRLGERKFPVMLRRASGKTALETLIRLFILGEPVDIALAAPALAPMTVDEWANIGLLSQNGTVIQPTVQLRCYQGMVVAYDFVRRGAGGLQRDYVMGVSPS